MAERAKSERWVLGDVGEQSAIEAQYATIRQDIMDRYRVDFINAWDEQISRLKIASVGGGEDLTVMIALSAPTSPMKQLMQSLTKETQLTKGVPEGGADSGEPSAVETAAQKKLLQQAGSAGGQVGKAALQTALDSAASGSGAVAVNYGERIEAHFKQLHDFAGETGGVAPVDNLVARFNNLYQAMNLMQAGGAAKTQGVQKMQGELQALKAETARMPGIVANMTEGTIQALGGIAIGSNKAQLNQALADQVTNNCQQIIANRYPFFPRSSREVPLADFARLFGPNGIMNTFFQQELAAMVNQSGRSWQWRGDTELSRTLSNQALRQFQRAAAIRDAFFATGGGLPQVAFSVEPVTLSPDAFDVTLDVEGQQLVYDHRAARATSMMWPGPSGGRVEVAMTPEISGAENRVVQTGVWGLFRLIRRNAALAKDDTVGVNFSIGSRQASFNIQASSVLNPFSMRALNEFRCPRGL
jgi:type VI secretion system protein ImpL